MPQLVRQSGTAVWAQIAIALRAEIERGLDEGDWLPAEPELAARFGVNRHTLRRAVDELIAEGLVERVHGRGTRVLSRGLIYGIGRDTKFTERLAASGRTAQVTLLARDEIVAAGGVARRLRMAEGTPVLCLKTLRGESDLPYALTLHFMTGAAAEAARSYPGGSLTRHLRAVAGITLDRVESLISTRLPLPADALALRMPRTQPVLRIKGVNACRECGVVQEYVITQFRGDRIQLSVEDPEWATEDQGPYMEVRPQP
ncbi:phosphonate metabolism transcriptional regulator PhnF [Yoonia sp.]|uniref:phosphonate metabolism transcriptional regulator PhnF n=1 Tax=Yoonia sp. TaxID=2212373 RepID=UPI0019E8F215|nr:phosphonate metabolism transcriptional regulator PhnF [Yoonia sp.]MBE0413707.1 phosphonate metabolism transcriptional regulator PhnF [Yoonia sp.]